MKKPKVVVKRNLKHKNEPVWGTAVYSQNPLIELDAKLKGFNHLTILCHEAIHIAYPSLKEKDVRHGAKVLAGVLWSQKYRRIDI